ncbi:molybdate ABC transporter substrate-binding protein [Deinococcus sp. MIMF12]|uniref:Molybdate ABC transporter substrate-binding protein n=1 Tax=Deinococcus rhizophilus TaxID=3049544 RepID=A0ABT7JHE3_9DEIO|nr:molybdate ABC transporter substrate-binding protein [Deinococcus rhizophilus]MDL2344485.1 molybdate ABC transporter substrate-binding protein [Deinococcus rhizophilus]
MRRLSGPGLSFRRALLAALILVTAEAGAARLTVFAASSLTDALGEIGRVFDSRTGHQTRFSFAGSSSLRTQLERGARADVFASASLGQYAPLRSQGLAGPHTLFARNRLTVLTPAARPLIGGLAGLARPGLRLIVAGPGVPAGEATARTLSLMDASGNYGPEFTRRVRANVVSEEPNVRQVALKVGLGQADAAFVYRSDLTPGLRGKVRTYSLPDSVNPPVAYPIGVLKGSREAEAAAAFIRFVRSPEGQRILIRWGFLPAP